MQAQQPLERAALVACVFCLASSLACAAPPDLPVRKAGHWKISTISATLGMTTIDACIGPGDSIAATTSPGECKPPEIEIAGDQTIVNVVCETKDNRETTSTLFTGDFQSWYRGIVKMTVDPPSPANANLAATIDAKYVGPQCLR